MKMKHYWGAKAIVERIGLRDPRRVPYLIKRYGLIAFLRRDSDHIRNTYYASESMIATWEIVRAMHYRETLTRKSEPESNGK